LILIVLVFGFLVQIVELEIPFVDKARCDLAPSVDVQFIVDVLKNLLEGIGLGDFHHIFVDECQCPLNV